MTALERRRDSTHETLRSETAARCEFEPCLRRSSWRCLSVFLLSASILTDAGAGVIRMQVSCVSRGDQLTVILNNLGDEAAQNVRANVRFADQEHVTDVAGTFPPDKPEKRSFKLDTAGLKGTYPAYVTIDFEDLNSYPFSSVSVHQVRIGKTLPSRLSASFKSAKLVGKAAVPLLIRNLGEQEIRAQCHIVTPRELAAPVTDYSVTIPPRGEETLSVILENFAATPASEHPVHAVIQYVVRGTNVLTTATSMVTNSEAAPATSKVFWIILSIAVAALLGAPLAALLKGRLRNREMSKR